MLIAWVVLFILGIVWLCCRLCVSWLGVCLVVMVGRLCLLSFRLGCLLEGVVFRFVFDSVVWFTWFDFEFCGFVLTYDTMCFLCGYYCGC